MLLYCTVLYSVHSVRVQYKYNGGIKRKARSRLDRCSALRILVRHQLFMRSEAVEIRIVICDDPFDFQRVSSESTCRHCGLDWTIYRVYTRTFCFLHSNSSTQTEIVQITITRTQIYCWMYSIGLEIRDKNGKRLKSNQLSTVRKEKRNVL